MRALTFWRLAHLLATTLFWLLTPLVLALTWPVRMVHRFQDHADLQARQAVARLRRKPHYSRTQP